MQLFYDPQLEVHTEQFSFTEEESKHIVRVLRKKVDDSLQITNGKGHIFQAKILVPNPKNCVAAITSATPYPQRPYKLHLAVAPTKLNDRFEWFLEKATEIGVDQITPIYCDRSERRSVKPGRMEKVVQSAMKQSLQAYLPQLNGAVAFREFMEVEHAGAGFIAHCEEGVRTELKARTKPNTDMTILIGPEGDFSPLEIKLALERGFLPVALGANRLRTETAAIVACATVALANT
tara:strand:+ start:57715 stop:58419 length:705 start_codon:yes stop_codon:yes gene_type:complete